MQPPREYPGLVKYRSYRALPAVPGTMTPGQVYNLIGELQAINRMLTVDRENITRWIAIEGLDDSYAKLATEIDTARGEISSDITWLKHASCTRQPRPQPRYTQQPNFGGISAYAEYKTARPTADDPKEKLDNAIHWLGKNIELLERELVFLLINGRKDTPQYNFTMDTLNEVVKERLQLLEYAEKSRPVTIEMSSVYTRAHPIPATDEWFSVYQPVTAEGNRIPIAPFLDIMAQVGAHISSMHIFSDVYDAVIGLRIKSGQCAKEEQCTSVPDVTTLIKTAAAMFAELCRDDLSIRYVEMRRLNPTTRRETLVATMWHDGVATGSQRPCVSLIFADGGHPITFDI